jgi:beta-galactosidase
MYGWVLINEPGVGGEIPVNDFTKAKYREWLKNNPPKEFTEKGYPVLVELNRPAFFARLQHLVFKMDCR